MRRFNPIYAFTAMVALALSFVACNEDDDYSDENVDNSSLYAVVVNTFSLNDDDSILANLDSVYFSIDLNRALIYNADSLPLGTRVDSLHVTMSLSSVSKAEITMPSSTGADTVLNFLTHSTSAIDFSRGYVKLHLESANELVHRDYVIYVNVHKMKPDSLAWGSAAYSDYPTSITDFNALRTVEYLTAGGSQALCFSTNGSRYCVASSANPGMNDWEVKDIAAPSGLNVRSIVAGEGVLYALDNNNALYTSQDAGLTWTATGKEMSHIYGVYGTMALGVSSAATGGYVYVTYPTTTSVPVPEDAPVEGTSLPLLFRSEWSSQPMMMVMGGLTASGNHVGSIWAYDGSEWTCTTLQPIAEGASNMMLVPYFSFKVNNQWEATKYTTLLAFGGTNVNGEVVPTVYMSLDRGVHWSKAGELMQLPDVVPALTGAEALVYESVISSRSASSWNSIELPRIPSWYQRETRSGAISPITSWTCPYIYMFGGVDGEDDLNEYVWRGVINRLSFKPLQ